jgi:hypothetical protein
LILNGCLRPRDYKWYQNLRLRSRARRRPMKRRSPPHILADEHFNTSSAEQRSYSAGGGLDGASFRQSNLSVLAWLVTGRGIRDGATTATLYPFTFNTRSRQ